ncbi:MAG: ABC transporter permease [Gemmatimonadales bacterium]
MSGVLRAGRTAGLLCLGLSALLPMLLLAIWSVGDSWFYPALWPSRLTAESWRALLSGEGRLWAAAATSMLLAAGTGAMACIVALPVGRALARLDGWRRHLGAALTFLPVAAPPVALATGLQFSFLSLGLGGRPIGVLLAHAVPAVAYVSLYFTGVFAGFDARVEEEARSLGASAGQTFWFITLPLLRRPLAEGFALGFLISWSQMPLTLLIGGGAVRTLPIEVFAFVEAGQDRIAATGALVLLVPALVALAAARLAASRTEVAAV